MKAEIAVKCILVHPKKDKILIVKRCKKDEIGADSWENAGGCTECGESLEEALRREIREETGITEMQIERLAYVTLVHGKHPYMIVAYICQALTENVRLSEEHQEYIWADEEKCRELLPQAIIDDFENNGIFEYFK